MKRILVATDISTNSGAALRFALQLAAQRPVSLTFLNVHNVVRPITWRRSQHAAQEQQELADVQQRLEEFVEEARQRVAVTIAEQSCVVINSFVVESTIMAYAEEHRFDFILVGARGAGTFEKLIGTTTATLINQSTVPVITVPANYSASPVKEILYASDLTSLEPEISRVVDVARPFGSTVHLVHVRRAASPVSDLETLQTTVSRMTDYPVQVHIDAAIDGHSLVGNLEQISQWWQPSLLIMFTTQRSGFLKRLLSLSHSAEYAFIGSVPLLVFTKT